MIPISLNIFTNCTRTSPNTAIIEKTYGSFVKTFGKLPLTIYIDPHPNTKTFNAYLHALNRIFGCRIVVTCSLSDGYVRSIKEGNTDYLFQLEHDWTFQNINHSLSEILDVMKEDKIYHFRFSKHTNKIIPRLMEWQTKMVERERNGIRYVETDNLSNNPHIIDRIRYLGLLPRIRIGTKSFGIEENLTKKGLIGCQYGGMDYPPTIIHLQGRKS